MPPELGDEPIEPPLLELGALDGALAPLPLVLPPLVSSFMVRASS
ncbi:MAG TPA: hypothetical protein VJR47_18075 [Stellaceae bacterium]|nr:hypothetical protein [Stellaceae bacterium]